jgi:hypothetical protein
MHTVSLASTVSEVLRASASRSERLSVFTIGLFSYWRMVGAVGLPLAWCCWRSLPFLQTVLGSVPLSIREWLGTLPFALLASIAAAVTKIHLRARARLEFARAVQMERAQREDVREVLSRASIAKEVRCQISIG